MPESQFPKREEETLAFWEKEKIFELSLQKPAPKGSFVFFEGPPTANGKPGIHHVEARAFKDLIPRFRTMQGYRVERKAGWDTHGLPVELEVEKSLGISGKPQIETLKATPEESIAFFNEECKKSVWKYLDEWIRLTKRIGFWLDLDRPYVTYETPYIESLWAIIKRIHDRGLLERDYKVVPYCPRCGTPLSSHEVAQGYKERQDVAIYPRFEIKKMQIIKGVELGGKFLLAWTTTPWTLPANVALAVYPDEKYTLVRDRRDGEEYLLASACIPKIFGQGDFDELEHFDGKNLKGLRYEPLFDFFRDEKGAFRVITADFVKFGEGTGVVHIAPAFGEDDLSAKKENDLPIIVPVDESGKFNKDLGIYAGMPVKEKGDYSTDIRITSDLRKQGKLFSLSKKVARHEGTYTLGESIEKDESKGILKELLQKEGLNEVSIAYEHTYPFCWRCNTPLIYYAKESWFIRMSKLRDRMIKANQGINWVPSHIRDGRFGEWLREVKDWAFSRERYWGTPLPIWICEPRQGGAGCGQIKVVGGLNDFPETPSGNTYYLLRHGQSETNTKNIASSDIKAPYHLTDKGKKQIEDAAKQLKKEKIDLIFASDYPRTKETAGIASEKLGVPITFEPRIREMLFGEYDELAVPEFKAKFSHELERFDRAAPGGETLREVLRRELDFIRELEEKHQNKRILLVGHGDPWWVLEGALRGLSPRQIAEQWYTGDYIGHGEVRTIRIRDLPRDADGFADLHRPYIDSVKFHCEKCGGWMSRVKEVADVWFDSGAMPFAQWHWPFENRKGKQTTDYRLPPKEYPADYISEAIDQTRGWFYTLLAVSTLLDAGAPYKNVICLGHVLDAKGQKMSKSRGNVVNPWEMIEKYGADAVRWYMYTANQPGDPKHFDERDLDQITKQVFLILWNVLSFYKTYRPTPYLPAPGPAAAEPRLWRGVAGKAGTLPPTPSIHVLDRWILARLHLLINEVTKSLELYHVTEAGRLIADFITDLSTWYVRRSRERFKTSGIETLREVLVALSKLMAPFTPFLAEALYQELTASLRQAQTDKKDVMVSEFTLSEVEGNHDSVHLQDWPASDPKLIDRDLLADMARARSAVELAHAVRAEAKIKVRQPLADCEVVIDLPAPGPAAAEPRLWRGVAGKAGKRSIGDDILPIIAEELNVKAVHLVSHIEKRDGWMIKSGPGVSIGLSTTLTPELKREGLTREIIRAVNDLRKQNKLTIADRIAVSYQTNDDAVRETFETEGEKIMEATRADSLAAGKGRTDAGEEVKFGEAAVWIGIKKI